MNKGIQLFHPDVVDVSSGVENENGKDEALIKTICSMCQRGSKRKEKKDE